MDFRTKRQLVVLVVVFLVLSGIGFLIYRAVAPAPTCYDNARNQNEEEVDCGGNCTPCAFKHQKPVQVFWTRFVKVRDNTFDVAAELRNPNVRLAAAPFDYEFRLYDTIGVLVAQRRGSSFIYPNETMHVVEVGLTSGRVIKSVELLVSNVQFVLSDQIGPDIIAGEKIPSVENDANGTPHSVVSGLVVNRTLEDVRDIEIATLMFDGNANLIAVNSTVLDLLSAGETIPVKFVWPAVFPQTVASVTIEARSRHNIPKSSSPR